MCTVTIQNPRRNTLCQIFLSPNIQHWDSCVCLSMPHLPVQFVTEEYGEYASVSHSYIPNIHILCLIHTCFWPIGTLSPKKNHERTLDMDEFVTTIDSTLSVHHRGSFSAICPVPILASAYTGQMSATNLVSPAYLGLLPLLLPTCLCFELSLRGTGLMTVLLH